MKKPSFNKVISEFSGFLVFFLIFVFLTIKFNSKKCPDKKERSAHSGAFSMFH